MNTTSASTSPVYQVIPELLYRAGLRTVFGLFGSANVAWVGHGVQAGQLQWIRTRHEETSVAAATAYSRVTGKVGVATTTLGPGFANTINALAAAVHDHVPVLLIIGQSPSNKMSGDFQTLHQREIAAALGAGFHQASKPQDVEPCFRAALQALAFNGVPQVLSIDEAMLDQDLAITEAPFGLTNEREDPDPQSVAAAVEVLLAAKRPLILAGQGAALADCRDDMIVLAELTGARLSTTLHVHRMFAGHPADVGVCGKSSSRAVMEALNDTDVVVAVGASLNSFTTADGGMFPAAKIIQCEIDVDRDFKASSPELGLLGDAGSSVRALIKSWRDRGEPPRPISGWVPSWSEMEKSVRSVDLGHDPARGLDLRTVYAAFNKKLPQDRIIVTDGGRAGLPSAALLDARDGRSWLPSRGYGSIGLGIAASIGAAVAAPDRPVTLFCGDGGFMMSAQELDTIRLHNLRVTIIILNDSQYGSEIKYLNKFDLDLGVAQQSMPDVMMLTRAFGGDGVVITNEEELDAVQIPQHGLFVIDARIDPQVDPANL